MTRAKKLNIPLKKGEKNMSVWRKKDGSKTIVDVILRNTGYSSIEELLNADKKTYFMDHIDKIVELIKKAIAKGETITIVGDYDADGVTSTCILKGLIESLGGKVVVRIPHRLSEGYGINETIIDEIESGLVITVDNGIVAFNAIKKAKDKGLTVILTDHHELAPSGEVPCADIVLDPHIPGTADFEDYCGAGIAYKIAKEMLPKDSTLIKKLSCFAAIGTIADVVPLVEENRVIVQEGLMNMVIYGHRTSGLYSLLKLFDLDKRINEHNVAFKIGPAINAPGRLLDDGAEKVVEILSYDGPFEEDYAKELIELNDERKKLVAEGMIRANNYIAENAMFADYPLVIADDFHEGIVGIIAGKFAEDKKVPTFVLTNSTEKGILKGSGRSVKGINMKEILDELNKENSDILVKYGGHEGAAGVSIFEEKLDDFTDKLQDLVEYQEFEDVIEYDLEISVKDIKETIEELKKYAPYGAGNERIIFKISDYKLSPRQSSYYATNGEDGQNVKLYGVDVTAIGFGMTERYIDSGEPKELEVVGKLGEVYYFNNKSLQIELMDFRSVKSKVSTTKLAAALAKARSERKI